MTRSILKLIRVRSWIKNTLIFIPLVFGGLFTRDSISWACIAFVSFSLVSSSIYIINDLMDVEDDRRNPEKCTRPIASGKFSAAQGLFLSLLCMVLGMGVLTIGGGHTPKIIPLLELVLYVALNMGYSFGLKRVPLVDIFILASGFTIRVFFGAAVLGVNVSNWVTLTVFSGAIYLAMGKRRNELEHYGTLGRKVLEFYTVSFLDRNMQVFMALCLVFYSLACASNETVAANMGVDLTWTIPLVTFIYLRYNLDLSFMKEGDPVSIIFKDKWLLGLILLYGISVSAVLYLSYI